MIYLDSKEERRQWQALARLAPADNDDPSRAYVVFDGRHAMTTDRVALGVLEAPSDLPERDGEVGPVMVPAELLRAAVGMAKDKTPVRIILDPDACRVVLGEDPLPGMGEAPTVTIPYGDTSDLDAGVLARLLHPDKRTPTSVDDVAEVVTRVGLDAARLAKLSALEYRRDKAPYGYVTIRPRPGGTILEVYDAGVGALLGVLSRYVTEWPGARATSGGTTTVTIDAAAADRLRRAAEEAPDA